MKTTYYYNSPMGTIKLICSDEFLQEVHFVKEEGENPKNLSKIVSTCKEQLDEYFAGRLKKFSIPLEFVQGTDFQKKVWEVLQSIPYGQTRSYQDIAIQIGNPKAVRAVGGANNKNPIAIIVPCHRVIGKSGKLVGYAGGVEKKEMLLKLEKGNK